MTERGAEPTLIIRPRTGWAALDLRELWAHRDLLLVLAGRDLKLRYRQTLLGVAWVVLQPLLAAGIFTLVFGHVAKLPSGGVPYFVFSYAGMVAWLAFGGIVSKTGTSLVGNAALVSKVYFPRLILPLSAALSTLVDLAVALGLMVVLMLWARVPPPPQVVLLPVWLLIVVLMALGVGLVAAALAASYRDVQYVVPVLLQLLLYASPVAYGLAAVPPRLRMWFDINPLSGVLEAVRWSLLGTPPPSVAALAYGGGCAAAICLLGAGAFRRMERRFADVI